METIKKCKIATEVKNLMMPLDSDERIAMLEVIKFGYFHDMT